MPERSKWTSCSVWDGGEDFELRCPRCGCPKIVGLDAEDMHRDDYDPYDLGRKVSCWECGHKFTVTENCWVRCDES